MTPSEPVRIRPYAPDDLDATLDVFAASVRRIAARDYTPEQIAAWATAC